MTSRESLDQAAVATLAEEGSLGSKEFDSRCPGPWSQMSWNAGAIAAALHSL